MTGMEGFDLRTGQYQDDPDCPECENCLKSWDDPTHKTHPVQTADDDWDLICDEPERVICGICDEAREKKNAHYDARYDDYACEECWQNTPECQV
jgi:hypothetical protein